MVVHDPIFIRLTELQSKILNHVYGPSLMPTLGGIWTVNKEEMTFDEWEDAKRFAKWVRVRAAEIGNGKFKRSMNALAKKIEKAIEFPEKVEKWNNVTMDGAERWSGAHKSVLRKMDYQRFTFKEWKDGMAIIVDKEERIEWFFHIRKIIQTVGIEGDEDEDYPDDEVGGVVNPNPPYTGDLPAVEISRWRNLYGFELPTIVLHQDDKEKSVREILPRKLLDQLIEHGMTELPPPTCSCGTVLRIVAPDIGWCDGCKQHQEMDC